MKQMIKLLQKLEKMERKNKLFYIEQIKHLIDIEDTDIYDKKIDILLGGAIQTVKTAGIPEIDIKDELSDSYAIILAMEVSKGMDIDFNHENLQRMYITAVNTLRSNFL